MARSPLLRALRAVASVHAEASARHVSPARVRDERAEAVSRRSVLRWTGAAAGVAIASRARVARATGTTPRIAILGGGIAGLNAALTLSDAGFASTVYEANGRVGGRMHSNTTTWDQGEASEWCGEFIDSGHKLILSLCQRFGLQTTDELAAQAHGSTDTLYFFNQYYPVAQSDTDFTPVYQALQSQLAAAPFPTKYDSFTPTAASLDAISVYDWIEQYVPGGHGSPLGAYLDTAYNQEFGLDTDQQSSLNILYELGFQPHATKLSIYGESDQRFHILGGNEQLPQAIAASLPAGAVRLHHQLTAISVRSDGVYVLSFDTPSGPKDVHADKVIMTIPFSVLRGIDTTAAGFDSLKNTAIQQLGYGTNTKLALQFTGRLWDGKGAWGKGDGSIYTDLYFQNAWDSSRGLPGTGAVLTAYLGGSHGASFTNTSSPYASADNSPAARAYAQQLLTQLELVWPGVSAGWNGKATVSTPWRDPTLLGSYSCWKVGQYTLFSGYEKATQGACYFAGEHTSTSFQGFMQGGAASGQAAAKAVLTALGA